MDINSLGCVWVGDGTKKAGGEHGKGRVSVQGTHGLD